jgi:hypothetical protein
MTDYNELPKDPAIVETVQVIAKQSKTEVNVITTDNKVISIYADKAHFEDHYFQTQVMAAFRAAPAGEYKLDGQRVVVEDRPL